MDGGAGDMRNLNQYWKRWMREYVPTLIERKKWFRSNWNAEVGDRVLVIDENSRRGEWPVGTIVKVYRETETDSEGIVRHVTVKTESNEYNRPVTNLCLISEGSKDAYPGSTRCLIHIFLLWLMYTNIVIVSCINFRYDLDLNMEWTSFFYHTFF
jgi:hypothetical protein